MLRRTTFLLIPAMLCAANAQDRLPGMPGYERYVQRRADLNGAIKRGDLRVTWAPDSRSLYYTRDGKTWKVDVSSGKPTEFTGEVPSSNRTGRNDPNGRRRFPERGRQFTEAFSPDGKLRVFTRDGNAFLSDPDGKNETALTTEGNATLRIKFASGSWVYGEELGQRDAMGWSPDSKHLWFYRFDDSKAIDYYLALDVTKTQNRLDIEAYPKAGAPNPEVDIFVHNLEAKRTVKVDVRSGKAFGDDVLGHYVYAIRFSPDGRELFFHRTNRHQNTMEFCAADLSTGKVRVIVRESNPDGWTDNVPDRTYLDEHEQITDAQAWKGKMLWKTERNGYYNFAIASLDGKEFRPITAHQFEVGNVVKLDLKAGKLYYMARSAPNPFLMQLHCVGLDGKGERRLTDPTLSHSVQLAPDGKNFVDVAESVDTPPTTRLVSDQGKVIATLASSDISQFKAKGFQTVERFTFPSADGKFTLYGYLEKPSNFDPSRKYPVLIDVYAGPESGGGAERFESPDSRTELGFLVARFDGRVTNGRGKAFRDAAYLKLGIAEIDDQAAGVKALGQRPYVDSGRVGISGTSYGGYASAMCILRYPELFQVAVASSSVTDWRNYDTIYTERYMRTPQENAAGYDAGSCMTYAANLKGRLMLYYGTADNNVHPANTYQLVRALQRTGRSHDLQVGPDQGHTGVNSQRMLEYFIEHLIVRPTSPGKGS